MAFIADLSIYSLVRYEIASATPPMENREIIIERKVYNIEVIAFNLSTVALVSAIALGIFLILSFEFTLFIGGLFYWLRWDAQRTLAKQEVLAPGDQLMQALIGLTETQASQNILANLRFAPRPWSHTEIRLFGVDLWKNLLPIDAPNHF